MSTTDEEFIKSLRETLDESENNLDATIRSRLTRVRHQALTKRDKKKSWLPGVMPASAFASLLVAVLFFSIWSGNTAVDHSMIEDMELLSSNESLDMFEELEFYEWLEFQTS